MNCKKLVCIGRIVNVHGLKGDLKVKVFTSTHFEKYRSFFKQNGEQLDLKIKRKLSDDMFLAQAQNVETRDQAETWRNIDIYILREDMPALDENEVYYIDLIGSKVIDEEKNFIGIITDVDNYGAGEVLEIQHENKKYTCSFLQTSFIDETTLQIPLSFLIEC
jgi:16S rRNA processing protein RimM